MPQTDTFTTPCLLLASRSRIPTEQEARYARILRLVKTLKARREKVITVRLADLEALIAIAATSDAAVRLS